jgi:hypothetical protein
VDNGNEGNGGLTNTTFYAKRNTKYVMAYESGEVASDIEWR